MLNDNQINEIANMISAKEVKDYISNNPYAYRYYEIKEELKLSSNAKIRLGFCGAITLVGGAI